MGIKIKLTTKTNKKAMQTLQNLKDGIVKVGFWGDRKEPNGLSVVENAYMQENGFFINNSVYVPPRPFMHITMNENKDKWAKNWKKLYKSVLDGKRTFKQALDLLGYIVKRDLQETLLTSKKIRKNKESTLAIKREKGSPQKPLLDSLAMYYSIQIASMEKR